MPHLPILPHLLTSPSHFTSPMGFLHLLSMSLPTLEVWLSKYVYLYQHIFIQWVTMPACPDELLCLVIHKCRVRTMLVPPTRGEHYFRGEIMLYKSASKTTF
jgi:hypothetical protein